MQSSDCGWIKENKHWGFLKDLWCNQEKVTWTEDFSYLFTDKIRDKKFWSELRSTTVYFSEGEKEKFKPFLSLGQ